MSDDELDRHLNKILLAKGYNVATSCLRQAIDEAVRAEREACAKLAEDMPDRTYMNRACRESVAAAIRNRSNT